MSSPDPDSARKPPKPSADGRGKRSGRFPPEQRLRTKPGNSSVVVVPRLLTDERTRTIVGALAEGPRRPFELEDLPGIVRSALYARLAELTALGVFVAHRFAAFPLRVEYRLSDAGRTILANELLIERQERRRLAGQGPAVGAALGDILRLLAPIAFPRGSRLGNCAFVEHDPPEHEQADSSLMVVSRGGIVLSERVDPLECDAQVTATPDTWSDVLLAGPAGGLVVVGDDVLARVVLTALLAALRA